MKLGVNEFTTVNAPFADDVALYRAAGADAIGICEFKLGDDAEALAAVRGAGLAVSACVPAVPSILPLPLMEGPADPAERVEAIRASIRRLARFEPACVLFLTGPGDDRRPEVVEGIRQLADEAARAGVPVALEPVQRDFRDLWTVVSSLGEAAALLEEAGTPEVGLLLDTWHLWNQPDLLEEIDRHGERLLGVHVADRREPTRNTNDRVLPGDGTIELAAILRAVHAAGWRGAYDLEIFSDLDLPDSLWAAEPHDVLRRGLAGLRAALDA